MVLELSSAIFSLERIAQLSREARVSALLSRIKQHSNWMDVCQFQRHRSINDEHS
jgi:hypothetical protein